jgi:hypothetical protein
VACFGSASCDTTAGASERDAASAFGTMCSESTASCVSSISGGVEGESVMNCGGCGGSDSTGGCLGIHNAESNQLLISSTFPPHVLGREKDELEEMGGRGERGNERSG